MSFEWGDYMQIATQLCQIAEAESAVEEAAYRAAISRSYYALYNKCLAHHRRTWGNVMSYPGLSHHAALEKAYRDKAHSFADSERKTAAIAVADALDQYRQMRNQADYDDTLPGVKPKAAKAVRKIEVTIGNLSSI